MSPLFLKIRNIREQLNFKQSYVAEQLEISERSYRKIETGKTRLSEKRILQLAKIFHIKPEELFIDDRPQQNKRTPQVSTSEIAINKDQIMEKLHHLLLRLDEDRMAITTVTSLNDEINFLKAEMNLLKIQMADTGI